MEIGSKMNFLIKSAESWCCAGSFNVPGMYRARRLGCACLRSGDWEIVAQYPLRQRSPLGLRQRK